jgi:Transport protein Trs120 or TRAPPC9, TRAPP II complex subunit
MILRSPLRRQPWLRATCQYTKRMRRNTSSSTSPSFLGTGNRKILRFPQGGRQSLLLYALAKWGGTSLSCGSFILVLIGSSTNGGIFISYGHLYRRQLTLSQPPEMFHTRQLSYPVLVTVYRMLECHNMDILPISVRDRETEDAPRNKRQELLKDVEEVGWCLFSIDVRNTYGLPFEVTLERVQKGWETSSPCNFRHTDSSAGASPASTSCVVAPGAMIRYTSFCILT